MAFIGGSISGGEILIILVVMLLLFGSKNLPKMARNLGRAMEEFRRASREVTDEIMRADLDKDEPAPKSLAARPEAGSRAAAEEASHPEVKPRPAPEAIQRDETAP